MPNTVDIARPTHTTEVLFPTLEALYAAGKPSKYGDLAKAAQLHPANVSQSLSALKDIGFCEPSSGRGYYTITESGKDFVRYYSSGKRSECRTILREAIMNREEWKPIVAFLRTNKNKKRNPLDLALDIERRLDKQWSQSMRQRVSLAYRSILEFADLVEVSNGDIISKVDLITDSTNDSVSSLPVETTAIHESREASNYENLNMSQFSISVKKDRVSLEFLLEMVKPQSMLHSWLQQVLKEMKSIDAKNKEV